MNPNNCSSCKHKKHPDGGHCYMFRLAPTKPCAQHTVRALSIRAMFQQTFTRIAKNAARSGK